jgi:hypothetical protein
LVRQGALLQQSDWRLGQRGLLIPEGGLCASTTAVNVLHAAFSHLGRSTSVFQQADDLVARLVGDAWHRLGKDARMGLDFWSLSQVVNEVANGLHADVGVWAERPHFWRDRGGIRAEVLRGDDDTLSLLCVTTSARSSHAIALLDLDERRGVVTYSDPNHPHQLQARRYWPTADGSIQIDGFGGYGVLADVLHLRTKNYDYQASHQWGHFTGKRCWITDREGHRHLASIDRVDQPSPEYPEGRVVAYDMCFGSGGGGTWEMYSIAAIEEAKRPDPKSLARYQKLKGQDVRIRFADENDQRQHGDKTFRVLGLSDEVKRDEHPYGGVEVKELGRSYGGDGVVAYERIAGIEPLEGRVPRAPHRSAPSATRKKRQVI